MKSPGRRKFIVGGAAVAAAAATLATLPPIIRKALMTPAYHRTGTIQDVEHVVVLMLENRSFNHYFGTLSGVRGFGDRFPIPLEGGKPVWYQSDGTREITPYHLDSDTSNALFAPPTPHTFSDAQAAWAQGKFGFWPKYKLPQSMGYYRRRDIPFQFALAEAFTLCDAYHCSVTTGTDPNRIVLFSGSNFDPAVAARGSDCTAANSEPDNLRCWITGTHPTPGYAYQGSAFTWPTVPDVLEGAGVSWRIYQDPNDNWDGAMHGGLAFESFRSAKPGSALYRNGMTHWSLEDLARDVRKGALPAVSWLLPTKAQSEHPGAPSSPAAGAAFVAQVLEALTADAHSWSRTALFITYDENDGLFDHVPPPAVPPRNADGTLAGKSTLRLNGQYFYDPGREHLLPDDRISGTVRPWGLGPRVPMLVVSPWSTGGWVNSQVFDHSSVGMFIERRFGITLDSISPWRRAVCGDLTSAFDFRHPDDRPLPAWPETASYRATEARQRTLPETHPPSVAMLPSQEPGVRPSRALPYALDVDARTDGSGGIELTFANRGAQGAVLHVYDAKHLDRIPRRYTLEAGGALSDTWNTPATDDGHDLWIHGPGGFVRQVVGTRTGAATTLRTVLDARTGSLRLVLENADDVSSSVRVHANAYRGDGPWDLTAGPGAVAHLDWDLASSANWYDLTASTGHGHFRFAGRIETGRHGSSDPASGLA